jgi:hypothetical protein
MDEFMSVWIEIMNSEKIIDKIKRDLSQINLQKVFIAMDSEGRG